MARTKKEPEGINYILAYYQKIKDKSITVGEWIDRLYSYIVKGLEDKLFFYDQKKADKAIKFIETRCHHSEGVLAPNCLKLELWQKALVASIFGIVDDKGCRQFREIVLIVARKNGKSLLASAIAYYTLQIDGGYGTRIYCLAPKLDQADILYNDIWQMVVLDPNDQILERDEPEKVRHRMTDYYLPATNSTVKKIAFSAKKSDGFNPSLTICDEVASWAGDKGLKQYEVMKSGMGARPEGLLLSCSTAGYENDGIYDELVKRGTAFLLGNSKEKRLLPIFYMIDDATRWNDINELQKSNPNLGVSTTVDYLLEEIAIAENSLSKRAEFLCKYCNVKQNSSSAWINAEDVTACFGAPLDLNDFKNSYCIAGVDLSRTTDLSAAVCIIEKDGILNVFSKFFLPGELIEEATARDGLPYAQYIKRGLLVPSGDNFIDYHDIERWFMQLVEEYQIYPLKVGYDRYSAQYLVQDLKAYGFHMDDVYQGYNLTPVINETYGTLKDKRFNFGDNDLLKIHLLSSALKHDTEQEKVKLIKLSSREHIDGTAALLDAMCVRQKYWGEIGEQLKNE